MRKITLTVELNGTNVNPFAIYGLRQNPLPQLAEYEFTGHCLQLQKLAGDPIPNIDYIREVLKGWSQEFVDLCCSQFVKGKTVTFTVKFNV